MYRGFIFLIENQFLELSQATFHANKDIYSEGKNNSLYFKIQYMLRPSKSHNHSVFGSFFPFSNQIPFHSSKYFVINTTISEHLGHER